MGPLLYAGFVLVCLVGLGFGIWGFIVCLCCCLFFFCFVWDRASLFSPGWCCSNNHCVFFSWPGDWKFVPSCCLPCLHKNFWPFLYFYGGNSFSIQRTAQWGSLSLLSLPSMSIVFPRGNPLHTQTCARAHTHSRTCMHTHPRAHTHFTSSHLFFVQLFSWHQRDTHSRSIPLLAWLTKTDLHWKLNIKFKSLTGIVVRMCRNKDFKSLLNEASKIEVFILKYRVIITSL